MLATLRKQYEISIDWNGNNYLSLHLDWSYDSIPKHVTLSMPKYVPEGLNKLQHPAHLKPQHSPAKHIISTYGSKTKYDINTDYMQPVLHENEIKHIQREVGITSYYAASLDNSALVDLNDLAAAQAKAKKIHERFPGSTTRQPLNSS